MESDETKEIRRLRRRESQARYLRTHAEELKLKKASWYQRNKAAINARKRAKYKNDPAAARDRASAYRKKFREKASAAVVSWCKAHPDRVRELGAKRENRRRARIRGGLTIAYERYDIFLRDDGICYLCKKPIDYGLKHPDPFSFSIDHLYPIVKLGADAPFNVASTHLICNQRKSALVLDELPSLPHIHA